MNIKNWLLKKLGCNNEQLLLQIQQKNDVIANMEMTISEKKDVIKQLDESLTQLYKQYKVLEESKKKPKEATYKGEISLNDAKDLFSQFTNSIYLSDVVFSLTSKDEAEVFSNETRVKYGAWTPEEHDCDNFSFALMGYWSDQLKSFAFGMAWSQNHAFNIMIDEKRQLWIIEPQTNRYMTIQEARDISLNQTLKYYPIRLIIM